MASLIFARPDGQWFDFPPLQMAAASGDRVLLPAKSELFPYLKASYADDDALFCSSGL